MNTDNLLPHQVANVAGILAALRLHGAALDGGDTGTGKTYEIVGVARELQTKPLVVCPLAVQSTWHRVAKFLGGEVFTINYEALKGESHPEWGMLKEPEGIDKARRLVTLLERMVALVGPMKNVRGIILGVRLTDARRRLKTLKAKCRFEWNKENIPLIIFDECHRCKGATSINGKMLIAAKRQAIPVICASATAAMNPLDMKGLGYTLGLHAGVDFWQWCRRNGCYPAMFGGLKFSEDDKWLKRLHGLTYPSRGVRTRREDIPDFPESQITAELFDLENCGRIEELYREMGDALNRLQAMVPDDPELLHPLTALTRIRQQIELLKVPVFVELTEDAIEEKMSVAIFVNYNETVDQLIEKLRLKGIFAGQVRGGQTAHAREECIAAFQRGDLRVIVCNIQAGGLGVSLHDLDGRFARLALISPTYSAIDLIQVFGRVWRQGQKTKSLQRVILVANTIEEKIHFNLTRKLKNISLLNDGDLNNIFK